MTTFSQTANFLNFRPSERKPRTQIITFKKSVSCNNTCRAPF
ncbi:hypothetical protein HanPSC8_Chr09g0386691 [Helianthus annuus]|nr:hypothetical protein HanPSC8_Chr09g0386691 [Helianthus annuus]